MGYRRATLSAVFGARAHGATAWDAPHSASAQPNRIGRVQHGASEKKKVSVLNLEHGFCKRNKMAAPP
ncbi:hypothetical protein C5976_13645 [Cronobacter sakazakii]|nr:hypothetical protein [Cronobacter sakazakii]NCH41470.1 hypothetical protein [Cronobacter sakazakii]NCH74548.1 hypothetical protein [Cronobacter sakazakii]PQV78437.1 hypothetical protein CDT89_11700 [Cronobacter sakazakii]PQY42837.1 hypothetical protein C5947_03290 [Cronobacter sakazakii]